MALTDLNLAPRWILATLLVATVLFAGCRSSADTRDDLATTGGPRLSSDTSQEGILVERLDADGNGVIDIIRTFELFDDPREPGRTRRRIKMMELDVNSDGVINVRRHYDQYGNVEREENDLNLDGQMDTTLFFAGGELARKELLANENGAPRIKERRIYFENRLVRVERDQNRDGNIDSWEYYEDGVLMRIGRDTVGDGAADTWQFR